MGGIVIPIEYALCQALIPEEYKYLFQGKTELLLAFDFEVLEENEEAEFVTFGSYILDQLLYIIGMKTETTVRYVLLDKITLANAEMKIKKILNMDRGTLSIEATQILQSGFVVYNFISGFTIEERTEERNEIWIDIANNRVSEYMKHNRGRIFCGEQPDEIYPITKLTPIIKTFETAMENVKQWEMERVKEYKDDSILENEIARIEEYYGELIKENQKKKNRKGITGEKIKELEGKEEMIVLEKERQLKEIANKFSVVTDTSLENCIVYLLPIIQYKIKLEIGHQEEKKIIYYNSITKSFDLA